MITLISMDALKIVSTLLCRCCKSGRHTKLKGSDSRGQSLNLNFHMQPAFMKNISFFISLQKLQKVQKSMKKLVERFI